MAKAKVEQGASTGATTDGKPADATKTEKKERAPVNKTYEFVKDPGEADKLAPQAKIIVEEIKKAGKVDRAGLVKALQANTNFKTRQPVERIVTYYQKDLEKAGLIKVA